MASVMDGEATPAQLGGLLLALRMRGEKVDELTGFAMAMRERVVAVSAPDGAIDTCGTGGDGSKTFNISTAVCAGRCRGRRARRQARQPGHVVGDRLGRRPRGAREYRSTFRPTRPREALATDGFAFLFAPELPPGDAPRGTGAPRARRAHRVQPAWPDDQPGRRAPPGDRGGRPDRRGQGRSRALPPWARSARFVVHGDGVDELPLDGSGVAYDVSPGGVRKRRIDSSALGLARAASAELRGGDAAENARDHRGRPGRRERVRGATSCCSTPARRLLVAGRVPTLRHGVASRGDDDRQRPRAGTAWQAARAARGHERAPHDRRDSRTRHRPRDRRAPSGGSGRTSCRAPAARERRGSEPRAAAAARSRDRVCTSSPRSSDARRPSATSAPTTTSSRVRAPTSAAAPRRSPSCASRTGSTARSTICARSAPPSASRSWPRTSSSRRSSWRLLRDAGADLVLLLAVLHDSRELRALVREARSLGLEPLVEAHDARELDRALGQRRAADRHQQPRPEHARSGRRRGPRRLRALVPDDRLVVAESGVSDPSTLVRWRALGFDAALIGEALMRAPDPARSDGRLRRRGRDARGSRRGRSRARGQDLRHRRRGRRARGDARPVPTTSA